MSFSDIEEREDHATIGTRGMGCQHRMAGRFPHPRALGPLLGRRGGRLDTGRKPGGGAGLLPVLQEAVCRLVGRAVHVMLRRRQ